MIDLRQSKVTGENEQKFADQLIKEEIPFRFGEIRAGNERQPGVFLMEKFAITFAPISPGIESSLRENKFKPQIWHPLEFRWQELDLRKRLQLHR